MFVIMSKKSITRKEIYNMESDHFEARNRSEGRIQAGETQDTITRREIHRRIIDMVKQGKGKIEILTELNNQYPDTYMSKFFDSWIDYHIEQKSSLLSKGEEKEER